MTRTAAGPVKKLINSPAAVRTPDLVLKLDTRRRQDLRDDDHAELDVALGDELGHHIGLGSRDFRSDHVRNPKTLQHARQVHSALALLQIGDRFGVEQRLLEFLHRADVGLARARPHLNTYPGACEIGARLGNDRASLDELIDLSGRRHEKIEGLPRVYPAHHANRDIGHDDEPVSGGALEIRTELVQHGRDRPGREDLDLGGGRDRGLSEDDDGSDRGDRGSGPTRRRPRGHAAYVRSVTAGRGDNAACSAP
jgi:hypothetical protein